MHSIETNEGVYNMINATVRHQTNRNHMFWEIDASEVKMADYNRVAFVSIPDNITDVERMLDFVYEKTNSVDVAWFASGSQYVQPLAGKCRSTSVGDIITIEGIKYMVASFGWKKL